jgi:formylglycine-generating enzyme required for sulfatase activity
VTFDVHGRGHKQPLARDELASERPPPPDARFLDTNTLEVACTNGKCALTCAPGFADCDGKASNGCEVDFGAPSSCGTSCETAKGCLATKPICVAGVCLAIPSCDGLQKACGVQETDSCCANNPVSGGTFNRRNDPTTTATVSEFRLDVYEITVGRFRRFVDAWVNGYRPQAGDGKHAHLNGGRGLNLVGGGYESGWDPEWESQMGTTSAEWDTNMNCARLAAWPAGKDYLPMNCTNWWEMAAFCVWDGGFLPSEAEWEYAATGGSEQRTYPWGNDAPVTPPAGTNPTLATYDCLYDGTNAHTGPCATVDFMARPGVLVGGRGRYYQHDLAGNIAEWTMDYFNNYPAECVDCANRTFSKLTVTRGGGAGGSADLLTAGFRLGIDTESRYDGHGARCARRP